MAEATMTMRIDATEFTQSCDRLIEQMKQMAEPSTPYQGGTVATVGAIAIAAATSSKPVSRRSFLLPWTRK